jgi:hypothetical protein
MEGIIGKVNYYMLDRKYEQKIIKSFQRGSLYKCALTSRADFAHFGDVSLGAGVDAVISASVSVSAGAGAGAGAGVGVGAGAGARCCR